VSEVCANCFDEPNIQSLIRDVDGEPGCDFCGQHDAPTMSLDELGAFILERVEIFYGRAADHLGYISREGGYVGTTYLTFEILYYEWGLDLPRDHDDVLRDALLQAVDTDEIWCERNPYGNERDQSLIFSWNSFCDVVKYRRRSFFHRIGEERDDFDDSLSPAELLQQIAEIVNRLIATVPAGLRFARARDRRTSDVHFITATDLGPPLAAEARQPNRMSPPGIAMLYGAETACLAAAELGAEHTAIGIFETTRDLRMLDLATLRPPGYFGMDDLDDVLNRRFLNRFAFLISQPIPRDGQDHIDYVPTQVFTEFLRDFAFERGLIDVVRYPTTKTAPGANLVFFATREDVLGAGQEPNVGWLRLLAAAEGGEEEGLDHEHRLPHEIRVQARLDELPLFGQRQVHD